jgi:hypothetical protein
VKGFVLDDHAPIRTDPMKSKPTQIDLDKLRTRIRRLGLEQAFLMLDEALGMLSQAQLHRLAKRETFLSDHDHYGRDKMRTVADRIASKDQRAALREAVGR